MGFSTEHNGCDESGEKCDELENKLYSKQFPSDCLHTWGGVEGTGWPQEAVKNNKYNVFK
jgi:hypothetical protein